MHLFTEKEGCAAILLACLRANDLDKQKEDAIFEASFRQCWVFAGLDFREQKMIADQWLTEAGSPELLVDAAASAVGANTTLPLFYHCLDVILSDGVVTPMENKVFQHLKLRLKISEEEAWKGIEVLEAKNRL